MSVRPSLHVPIYISTTSAGQISVKFDIWDFYENFFIIKPTRCTNFTNLFWHETRHVSDSSSAHHQEFIHFTLSNGMCHTGLLTAVEQEQDGTAVQYSTVCRMRADSIRHTVQPFTESDNTRCCDNTICPPEDGHGDARNMSRIVI